jgi:hypothetical protein
MTKAKVFETLGKDLDDRAIVVTSTNIGRFEITYQLDSVTTGIGYMLTIAYDQKDNLRNAWIHCWENSPQCAEDNKKAEGKTCPGNSKAPSTAASSSIRR